MIVSVLRLLFPLSPLSEGIAPTLWPNSCANINFWVRGSPPGNPDATFKDVILKSTIPDDLKNGPDGLTKIGPSFPEPCCVLAPSDAGAPGLSLISTALKI
jgi:hypothetical protein